LVKIGDIQDDEGSADTIKSIAKLPQLSQSEAEKIYNLLHSELSKSNNDKKYILISN